MADDDVVEQALDDALRKGFSLRWITETLDRVDRPGKSGTASLRRVLARPDREGRTPDSRFERLVERVIVGAKLPRPVRQHPVHEATGKLLGTIDVAWPDLQLGIEATSKRWHGALSQTRRDIARDAAITGLDWKLLYPEWRDSIDPATFVHVVAREYRVRALAAVGPHRADGAPLTTARPARGRSVRERQRAVAHAWGGGVRRGSGRRGRRGRWCRRP